MNGSRHETRPVKAIAAEADARCRSAFRGFAFAAEHREQAEHHAFVGDGIEVVELGRSAEICAHDVGASAPVHRTGIALAPCALEEVARSRRSGGTDSVPMRLSARRLNTHLRRNGL